MKLRIRLRRPRICALCVLLLVSSPGFVHGQDFTFTTNNDGTLTITRYTGPGGEVTVPDTINGFTVSSIGANAFGATSVSSVTIPGTVASIGTTAFQNCTSLTNVSLSNGLVTIGVEAFWFASALLNIFIPSSVTNIDVQAFFGCDSLVAIDIDGANAFYSSLDGVFFDKGLTTLFQCPARKVGAFTIPNSVTSIVNYAFSQCGGLTSVTLPNSITNIGDYTFSGCSGLTSLTIPNGVIGIGVNTFSGCSSLTNVTIPSTVTFVGGAAFFRCDSLFSAFFLGNAPVAGSYRSGAFGQVHAFTLDANTIVYYLPGTTGWGPTFADAPTRLWNPTAQAPGFQNSQFGFDIAGNTNIPFVVEASTDLSSGSWIPLQTNTLSNGFLPFTDPGWTNYPNRFYRIRWP